MRVCWVCCFGALVAATRVCLGCLLVAWRGVVGAVGVVVVWGGGCCVCFGWQGAVCVDVFGLLWHGVGLAMGGLCGVGFRGLGFRGLGLRVLGFGCRVKGLGISSISEGCRSRCCSWLVLQLFCFLQWLMMTLTSRYCNLVHADGGGFGNEMGCLSGNTKDLIFTLS